MKKALFVVALSAVAATGCSMFSEEQKTQIKAGIADTAIKAAAVAKEKADETLNKYQE